MDKYTFNSRLMHDLRMIVIYNKYEKILKEIMDGVINTEHYEYYKPNIDDVDFDIIWMILVLEFGDWDKTPSDGCLDTFREKDIVAFINELLRDDSEDMPKRFEFRIYMYQRGSELSDILHTSYILASTLSDAITLANNFIKNGFKPFRGAEKNISFDLFEDCDGVGFLDNLPYGYGHGIRFQKEMPTGILYTITIIERGN